MSNPFQAMARFAKQADPALDAANFSLAMQSAGNMGLAGFGVGAGARGMVGLWNMLKRNVNPPKLKYPGAVLTTVPIPVDDEEEKRTKISSPLGFQNQWYYEPSRVAAGGLGLFGGWKAMDALLDSRKNQEVDDEVSNAKNEFEQALVESYPSPRRSRGLSVGTKLGMALDVIYETLQEKKAEGLISDDTLGNVAGKYLAYYALPSALIAGLAGYGAVKGTNQSNILNKAVKQRTARDYAARPSDILAVPDPIRVGSGMYSPGGTADQDALSGNDEDAGVEKTLRRRQIIRGMA